MKNMNNIGNLNRFISVLVIVLVSLISCRKDKEVIDVKPEIVIVEDSIYCECTPIPLGPPLGYQFYYKTPFYGFASFNPSNDDEIVYFDLNAVYKYNLVTKVKTLLYQGNIISELSWSINDWILFRSNGIWKVKGDGSGLSLIPNSINYSTPKWNNDGTKIVCIDQSIGKTILLDEIGIVLDTLENCRTGFGSSWNHPQYLFSGVSYNDNVIISSPLIDELSFDLSIKNDFNSYTGCLDKITKSAGGVWVNDEIYYCHSLGIFKINLLGESQMIKQACNTEYYASPTLNQSKTKILLIRNETVYIDQNTLEYKKELWIMDLDGTMEKLIID